MNHSDNCCKLKTSFAEVNEFRLTSSHRIKKAKEYVKISYSCQKLSKRIINPLDDNVLKLYVIRQGTLDKHVNKSEVLIDRNRVIIEPNGFTIEVSLNQMDNPRIFQLCRCNTPVCKHRSYYMQIEWSHGLLQNTESFILYGKKRKPKKPKNKIGNVSFLNNRKAQILTQSNNNKINKKKKSWADFEENDIRSNGPSFDYNFNQYIDQNQMILSTSPQTFNLTTNELGIMDEFEAAIFKEFDLNTFNSQNSFKPMSDHEDDYDDDKMDTIDLLATPPNKRRKQLEIMAPASPTMIYNEKDKNDVSGLYIPGTMDLDQIYAAQNGVPMNGIFPDSLFNANYFFNFFTLSTGGQSGRWTTTIFLILLNS